MEKIIELQSEGKPTNVWIAKVELGELKEQDKNARIMSKDMFDQLKQNIHNKGGLLESLPFCAMTDKGIEIISGHHRVRASRAAGINEINIILDMTGLTRDEIVSKQLSHNSISGIDDEQILLELYESIQDVDEKIASFIDAEEVKSLIPIDVSIGELSIGLDFHSVNLMFLPNQLKDFTVAIDLIEKGDDVVIADLKYWDEFKSTVNKVREVEGIKSVGMALAKMCQIAIKHYEEKDGRE